LLKLNDNRIIEEEREESDVEDFFKNDNVIDEGLQLPQQEMMKKMIEMMASQQKQLISKH